MSDTEGVGGTTGGSISGLYIHPHTLLYDRSSVRVWEVDLGAFFLNGGGGQVQAAAVLLHSCARA